MEALGGRYQIVIHDIYCSAKREGEKKLIVIKRDRLLIKENSKNLQEKRCRNYRCFVKIVIS